MSECCINTVARFACTERFSEVWFPYVGSVMGPHDMYYHFAQLDLSSRKQLDATMSAHYEFGGTEQTLKYGYPQRRRDLSTGKSSPVKQRER